MYPSLFARIHKFNPSQRAIANAMGKGDKVIIKPTKSQRGGFVGSLLASIGIPLNLQGLMGKGLTHPPPSPPPHPSGYGLQVNPPGYYYPQPFIGSWDQSGKGRKNEKSWERSPARKKNSPFNKIPILGNIL